MNKNNHDEIIRKTNRSITFFFLPSLYCHYPSSPISDLLSTSFITADSNHQHIQSHFAAFPDSLSNVRMSEMCKEIAESLNLLLLSGSQNQDEESLL